MGWLYEHNVDDTCRFVLGTTGRKPLICFGINPSTATPICLDNTLKSVNRITLHNGFDSWIMVNIYPQRATNPNDLHDTIDKGLHKENLSHIKRIFQEHRPMNSLSIWAAWGTLIFKRRYLIDCLAEIVDIANQFDCNRVSFGKISKEGHPHHPLYMNLSADCTQFPIKQYISHTMVSRK